MVRRCFAISSLEGALGDGLAIPADLRRRWRWFGLALLSSVILWIYSPVTVSFLARAMEAE